MSTPILSIDYILKRGVAEIISEASLRKRLELRQVASSEDGL